MTIACYAHPQAQLVGHNNAKQKIKYVERMREEISALKREVATLRAQVRPVTCLARWFHIFASY
jgi:uncharacterized protein (UPF0335 family)